MKSKDFNTYLRKRLGAEEIAEIEKQALFEQQALQTLQNDVSHERIG